MNDFVQMNIFFLITSIASVIFLFFISIVGIYLFFIIKKVNSIMREVEYLVYYASKQSRDSLDVLKGQLETVLSKGGVIERVVAAALGTILARTFKGRGKIK